MFRGGHFETIFDTQSHSVNIKGLSTVVRALKTVLELVIKPSVPTKLIEDMFQPPMQFRPSTSSGQEPRPVLHNNIGNDHSSQHIFPMDHRTDTSLVKYWHEEIAPHLKALLKKYLESCYTASLVRQGATERSSKVVIRIICKRIPSSEIKSDIQEQIGNRLDEGQIHEQKVHVRFVRREFIHLKGSVDDSQVDDDDEALPYPYYRLYWKHPGMGAPVGMLANSRATATLGCWIHIEHKLYLLTVKHFICSDVLKDFEAGKTPCLKVISPSREVLVDLREDLEFYKRQLKFEISREMKKLSPKNQSITPADVSQSETLTELDERQKIVRGNLEDAQMDPSSYLVGTVEYWSDSAVPKATEPRMDWAACRAIGKRNGANRHRYLYDNITHEGDYYDDNDGQGAGSVVQNVASITGDDEVHFVGQASGRVRGRVNMSRSVVNTDGVDSFEWTLIPVGKQKKAEEYRGDSGASVVRTSDNALVGLLWGATDDTLVFTPMEDVLANIKAKVGADHVGLANRPPTRSPESAIMLCSPESKPRPRRRQPRIDTSLIPIRPKVPRARARILQPELKTDPADTRQPIASEKPFTFGRFIDEGERPRPIISESMFKLICPVKQAGFIFDFLEKTSPKRSDYVYKRLGTDQDARSRKSSEVSQQIVSVF